MLERAAFLTPTDLIDAEDIRTMEEYESLSAEDAPAVAMVRRWPGAGSDGILAPVARPADDDGHWLTMTEMEHEHIRKTLQLTFGNCSAAARLLDMERHQLARKIHRYGLDAPHGKADRMTQSDRPKLAAPTR